MQLESVKRLNGTSQDNSYEEDAFSSVSAELVVLQFSINQLLYRCCNNELRHLICILLSKDALFR